MIASPHIVVGAFIGKETGNWFIASILSFLSHFILDFIPHPYFELPKLSLGSVSKFILIGCDIIIGVLLAWIMLLGTHFEILTVGVAIFFAILIDIIDTLPKIGIKTRWSASLRYHHKRIQNENISFFWGALLQILVILFVILIAKL